MPCESCSVQFSVFKRKRVCCECERCYCSGCLRRGGGAMCAPCRTLSTRPLYRNTISHLKVRDLQCFLQRQNVSTRGCVEKEELVSLCVTHVNSASYKRRGSRSSGAFSSLKGFTNNINDFINNAFDLRSSPPPSPPMNPSQTQPHTRGCFNSSHAHGAPTPPRSPMTPTRLQERFTTTPGGERDIEVPVPPAGVSRTPSAESTRVDTADCYEIEDLDDAGWEFVTTPADPLPNDSDVLISAADVLRREQQHNEPPVETRQPTNYRQPVRSFQPANSNQSADTRLSGEWRHSAHSDFERVPDSPPSNPRPTISRDHLTAGVSSSTSGGLSGGAGYGLSTSSVELRGAGGMHDSPDTVSLKDERRAGSTPATPRSTPATTLEEMRSISELETLSVKQLKELLARNRVEYRGCVERRELLERAARLWRELAAQPPVDDLSLEDACKICMAAPLECVLLECGHIAACTACSKQLAECPICRQYVVRAVRFFRS